MNGSTMNSGSINNLCRLCLCESNCFANIFAYDESQVLKISSIINELLDLEVSEGDGLPIYVCRQCLDKVMNIKLFKNQCQASKVKLHWAMTKGEGELLREDGEISSGEPTIGTEMDFCSVTIKVENVSSIDVDSFEGEDPMPSHEEEADDISAEMDCRPMGNVLKIPSVGDISSESKGMDQMKSEGITQSAEVPSGGTFSKVCPYCRKKYSRRDKLKYHIIRTHTKDYRHSCEHCGKCFPAQFMLTRHMRIHEQQYDCHVCATTFKTEYALRTHVKEKHYYMVDCAPADSPSTRGCLKDVSNRLTESPTAPFDHQTITSDAPGGVSRSVEEEQRPKSPETGCRVNSEGVANNCVNVWNRRLRSSVVPSVADEECAGEGVGEDRSRSSPVRSQESTTVTPPGSIQPASGNTSAESQGKGVGIHSSAVPVATPPKVIWNAVRSDFMCSMCGDGFPDKESLQKHTAKSHVSPNRTHVCQVCGYGTHRMSRLNDHLKTHLPDKPHRCGDCGFSSKWESELRKHLRTKHSNDPLNNGGGFRCDLCDKAFTTKRSLREHGFIHSGEKPFFCTVCHYRNHSKSQVKKHVRKVHGRTA